MKLLILFLFVTIYIIAVVIIANIIFVRYIYAGRKRYNISDYFYCSFTNQICMRFNPFKYMQYDYDYHKRNLYNGFNVLCVNQEYYCVSHSMTLRYLKLLEQNGYIIILRINETKKSTNFLKYMNIGWENKKESSQSINFIV